MKTKGAQRVFAFALLVALIVATTIPFAPNATPTPSAFAVSPQNYTQNVQDANLDWQMDKDILDIDNLKEMVSSWFVNPYFDFSTIKPVVIAVIDTGINYNHELFLGKYDSNGEPVDVQIGQYDVLYRNQNGNIIGANTVSGADVDNFFDDDTQKHHGTHVAGIIATLIHQLDLEKYIKIMPIKATKQDGNFPESAVNSAVSFAIEHNADVINMSLSSSSRSFGDAITKDLASKAVFVAAAGNHKLINPSSAYYPAGSQNVIGVMNYTVDENGNKKMSDTSNYGSYYDICAPGSDIYSADGLTDDGYKALSGTSMATPIVSFACALATLKYRATEHSTGESKTPVEIAQLVKDCATQSITISNQQYPVLNLCNIAEGEETTVAIIKAVEGSLTQKLGLIHQIHFTMTVLPYDEQVGNVEWFVNGELAGEGFDFSFTPNSEVAEIVIEGVWTYTHDQVEVVRRASVNVVVDYYVLDVPTIRDLHISVKNKALVDIDNLNGKVGDAINISFDNLPLDYISPNTTIIWFVNGEIVGNGATLEYTPSQMGDYVIQAKVNGVYTMSVVYVVLEPSNKQILTTISVALLCCIGGFAGIFAVFYFVKRSKSKKLV